MHKNGAVTITKGDLATENGDFADMYAFDSKNNN